MSKKCKDGAADKLVKGVMAFIGCVLFGALGACAVGGVLHGVGYVANMIFFHGEIREVGMLGLGIILLSSPVIAFCWWIVDPNS